MLRVRPCVALAALASLGLLSCVPAAAIDAALVRLIPPASTNVSAGERVTFSIELLVLGQFSGPTYFDLPEVAGAILMKGLWAAGNDGPAPRDDRAATASADNVSAVGGRGVDPSLDLTEEALTTWHRDTEGTGS